MGGRSLKPVWLQGFGQIELANVDGEHPVPVPERGGGLERFEQGGVHIPKGLRVELVARLAHGGGRDGAWPGTGEPHRSDIGARVAIR